MSGLPEELAAKVRKQLPHFERSRDVWTDLRAKHEDYSRTRNATAALSLRSLLEDGRATASAYVAFLRRMLDADNPDGVRTLIATGVEYAESAARTLASFDGYSRQITGTIAERELQGICTEALRVHEKQLRSMLELAEVWKESSSRYTPTDTRINEELEKLVRPRRLDGEHALDSLSAPKRRVDALILKGGGVKGIAFAGAMRELEPFFEFGCFVGTSAGAIAAVMLADGFSAQDLEAALNKLDFRRLLRPKSLGRWIHLLRFGGLYSGSELQNWIDRTLAEHRDGASSPRLEELQTRAVVFASQVDRGPYVFDGRGHRRELSAAFAARCSAAIPLFFAAPDHGGAPLYDGGLVANLPIRAFLDHEAELTGRGANSSFIALYLGAEGSIRPVSTGGTILSALTDAARIVFGRDERFIVETEHAGQVVTIDPSPIGTVDFGLSQAERDLLVLRGRIAALHFLAEHPGIDGAVKSDLATKLRKRYRDCRTKEREVSWVRTKRKVKGYLRLGAGAVALGAILFLGYGLLL